MYFYARQFNANGALMVAQTFLLVAWEYNHLSIVSVENTFCTFEVL